MTGAVKIPQNFREPAAYFVYAGLPDEIRRAGGELGLFGFPTLEKAEDWVFEHRKSHPHWVFQVWKSLGWERVEL